MKIIYEPAKPRYHVQYQNPDGEWLYWRGYATAAEAIIEADHMASRDSDNYRVVDSLQDDNPGTQFLPTKITQEQLGQVAAAIHISLGGQEAREAIERGISALDQDYEAAKAALAAIGISVEGDDE